MQQIKTSLYRQEINQTLKLAVPLAVAQLAQALTGFCDTLMMGRLGASTLAAGGLAAITMMTIIGIAGGVLMAVSPLVAEAYGARKRQRIVSLTRQGLYLAAVLTMPMAIAIANLGTFLKYQGQSPTTVALATEYLDIMVWACFPALGFMLLRGVLSGLDLARPVMYIVVVGTVFNVTLNYILGFGKLGLPRLEIRGLAIASMLSFWGMFLALIIYTIKQPRLKSYGFIKAEQINWQILRELMRLGAPIGIFIALESGLFAVVTYLMGLLGTDTLAAHQIVLQTVVILFMIPLGISYAATVRVGQWLGKQDLAGVKRAGYISVGVGLIFNIVTTSAILLFPRLVIGLYLDVNDPANNSVVAIATPLLTIGAIALVLDGMQKIIYGILQGLKDTRAPVLLSIPAFWGIGLTTGYFLSFKLALGGIGLWLGQSIGLAIAAMLFLIRLTFDLLNRLRNWVDFAKVLILSYCDRK